MSQATRTSTRRPKTKFMQQQEAAMPTHPRPLTPVQRESYGKLRTRAHLLRNEVPRMIEHAQAAHNADALALVTEYDALLSKLYGLANAALLADEDGR